MLIIKLLDIWAAPSEMCLPAYGYSKSGQGLCSLQKNHWILKNVSMESKCQEETMRMPEMEMNARMHA